MRRIISKFHDKEEGNIIILFAGSLIVLIFFIGLAIDVGMIALNRNSLQNLCQIVKEDRFTYQDSIRYAENPGEASYEIIENTIKKSNDFDGTVKVYFYEEEPKHNLRRYRIRTELSEEYNYIFARIFGLDKTTITVSMDGGETYGEGSDDASSIDVVWYPETSVTKYNGSYTSQDDGTYVHNETDFPADW